MDIPWLAATATNVLMYVPLPLASAVMLHRCAMCSWHHADIGKHGVAFMMQEYPEPEAVLRAVQAIAIAEICAHASVRAGLRQFYRRNMVVSTGTFRALCHCCAAVHTNCFNKALVSCTRIPG